MTDAVRSKVQGTPGDGDAPPLRPPAVDERAALARPRSCPPPRPTSPAGSARRAGAGGGRCCPPPRRSVPVRTAGFAGHWDAAAEAELRGLLADCLAGVRIILAGPESVVTARRGPRAAVSARPARNSSSSPPRRPERRGGRSRRGGQRRYVDGPAGRRVFCAACRQPFDAVAALGGVVTCPGCAAAPDRGPPVLPPARGVLRLARRTGPAPVTPVTPATPAPPAARTCASSSPTSRRRSGRRPPAHPRGPRRRPPAVPPARQLTSGLRWRPDRVNSYSLTGDGDCPGGLHGLGAAHPGQQGRLGLGARAARGRPGRRHRPAQHLPRRRQGPPSPPGGRRDRHHPAAVARPVARRWGGDFTLYYCAPAGPRGAPGRTARPVRRPAARLRRTATRCGRTSARPCARQPLGTQLYVCGPLGMIDAVTGGGERCALGRKPHPFRGIRGISRRTARAVPRYPRRRRPPRRRLRRGDAARGPGTGRGVPCRSLCRSGVCGECRTPVAGGRVDHRDLVLSAAEKESGDWIMPCVSRAAGDELELAL